MVALSAIVVGCHGNGPPAQPSPTQPVFAGRWTGSLTDPNGSRPCCLGDWSVLVLNLQASGDGELVTNDGQHYSLVSRTNDAGVRLLDLMFTPSSQCEGVTLAIMAVQVNSAGSVSGFTGSITGRCANTLINTFTFFKI